MVGALSFNPPSLPRNTNVPVRRIFISVCIVLLGVPLAPHSSSAAFVAVPQQLISDPSLLRLARANALGIHYSAIAYNSSVAVRQPLTTTRFVGLI
jgi:hypothetical protein